MVCSGGNIRLFILRKRGSCKKIPRHINFQQICWKFECTKKPLTILRTMPATFLIDLALLGPLVFLGRLNFEKLTGK